MISLIASLGIMAVLVILQTPLEWMKNKKLRFFICSFHAVGVASLILVLFFVSDMKDGFIREAVIWIETAYFAFTEFSLVLALVRYCFHEIARHFRKKRLLQLLGNGTVFYVTAMLITGLYLIPAINSATKLTTARYSIGTEKSFDDSKMTIVSIADLHIGAGARHREIDQTVELVNRANADVVAIVGDICDSSSSKNDLEYLEAALGKINSRMGIYFAGGNHEIECRTDYRPYLERAGVVVLEDSGVSLENGVSLVGRKYHPELSVDEVKRENGLDLEAPCIVLSHRAKNLASLDGSADLVLCGHTHGYQFPFHSLYVPYTRDMAYGYRKFGSADVVVTSGVSEWGYRSKWPSQSEIAVIELVCREDNE